MNSMFALALACLLGQADGFKERQIIPTNEKVQPFQLAVSVDSKDLTYKAGDTVNVFVTSSADCYLYVFNVVDDKDTGELLHTLIYPNKWQKDNFFRATGDAVQIPSLQAQNDGVRFKVQAPFGKEQIVVIGSKEPLKEITSLKPQEQAYVVVKNDLVQKMSKSLKEKSKQIIVDVTEGGQGNGPVKPDQKNFWAEASVNFTTYGKEPPATKQQRFAVCVGISDFEDPMVPDLKICHLDADHMADALQKHCGVPKQNLTVLKNEQATRQAIEDAIAGQLPAQSKPGDTIFIFFSCHGGRCADVDGDETDGVDEYLVPHDGMLAQPENTMILDDVFAGWMGALQGRQLVIVLDNCYSGGASKGLGPRNKLRDLPPSGVRGDFFDGELKKTSALSKNLSKRSKDIAQTDTVVLAASQPDQLAWEMQSQKYSVLTYYFTQALQGQIDGRDVDPDHDGDGEITAQEIYEVVKKPIQDYVQKNFQTQQTPLLLDNSQKPIAIQKK